MFLDDVPDSSGTVWYVDIPDDVRGLEYRAPSDAPSGFFWRDGEWVRVIEPPT